MNDGIKKILVVVVLLAAIGAVIAAKQFKAKNGTDDGNGPVRTDLPRLLELGSVTCIPCKMMKPILDELKQDYKEQFNVTFIDVWENPDEKKRYKINFIPAQIFYDASGKELFRHEGFFSKEDILGKWKEFGIDFEKGTDNEAK